MNLRKTLIFSLSFSVLLTINLHTAAKSSSPKVGLIPDFKISKPLFRSSSEYFSHSTITKKFYKKMKDVSEAKDNDYWKENFIKPEEALKYERSNASTVIYVPESYNGRQRFGLYLHISPSAKGIKPDKSWKQLMDKYKLIYISPNKTSNKEAYIRRIVLALDSFATVKSKYNIDPKRVYCGGLSGGGHMGMLCQMLYPKFFNGSISHAAQSYLPKEYGGGHFPGLSLKDVKRSPRKKIPWVVISGNKDFNYKEVKKTSKIWEQEKFNYRFIDVPQMRHSNASAENLEKALIFCGCKELSQRNKN